MPSSACIDLEQTRTQAKELLNLVRATDSKSLARIQNFHPEPQAFRNPEHLHLADCQLVIARELGYTSWAMLKQHVLYRSAVAALDGGNLPALEALLKKYPSLLQARCYRGEWYEKDRKSVV